MCFVCQNDPEADPAGSGPRAALDKGLGTRRDNGALVKSAMKGAHSAPRTCRADGTCGFWRDPVGLT